MARLIFSLILLLIGGTPAESFLFGSNKDLSPTSNVHVDVINHVNSALETHTTAFQHSWRDYLLVGLLLFLLTFCGYRRLAATFVRRPVSSSSDPTIPSITTGKY
jgi:hypothetical protein